jgi:predicted DCC family thiol-disulfide oxidoreductase YuxK
MTTPPADGRLLVLYDADCGVCSHSAGVLDRLDHGRRLRLVPLQDADTVVDAPPVEALLEAMHVRDPEGRWSVAGAAWIRIAAEVPLLRPLAVAARLAPVRLLAEWAYARVARNRHRISRVLGVDACAVRPRTQ